MPRSRSLAVTLVLLLATGAAPRVANAQPAPVAEVRGHMEAADRAAKAKDWDKAAAEYKAAFELARGAKALEGMANALYEAKRGPEAYEAYDELLRSYGDTLAAKSKTTAEARHKELAAQTGTIELKTAESGAEVAIDDKPVGTTPLPPRHVAAGSHKVRVSKAGFAQFEQTVNAAGGSVTTVDATLSRESAKGHLVVTEKDGKPMRVVIDGLDVGPTPFEGDVDPGAHEILIRSSAGASTPQRIEVERGKKQTIELTAVAAMSHLEVKTGDPRAILFFDGKPLAEGSFTGDVAPGEHTLVVSREGFERIEKKLVLTPSGSEKLDVTLVKSGGKAGVTDESPQGRGIYGGFALAGLGLPGGSGNELETRCSALGASACDTPMPIGGGLLGYVGYGFDPVGLEVMLGGEYDQVKPKATYTGYSGPNTSANPSLTGPGRTEQFTFNRGGGLVAVRARVSVEGKHLRGSFAGGFGASYKYAIMSERVATSTDGKNLQDTYAPKGQSYLSPAITLDGAVQWRVSHAIALSLGMLLWLESSSFTDVRAPGDLHRYMAAQGQTPAAITTPPYQITSGAQLFLGPYLGMQFGP